nr:hypothetical protein [Bifidobacterium bifidum]
LKYGSQVDQVLLEVLSDQLAESGAAVTAMRFKLLKRLETWSAQLHEHISQQKEVLKLKYISQVMIDEKTAENEIAEQLQKLYHEH